MDEILLEIIEADMVAEEEEARETAPPRPSPYDDAVGWAQQANMRAGRLAESIAPEKPWATDEEFPIEAFYAMWKAAKENQPRRRRVWNVDPVTEPLFDTWLRNLQRQDLSVEQDMSAILDA